MTGRFQRGATSRIAGLRPRLVARGLLGLGLGALALLAADNPPGPAHASPPEPFLRLRERPLDYGGPADRTSLAIFDEDEFYGYDDHVLVGGYRSLLTPLQEGLDVRLATPVTRVAYDAGDVRVETAGGEVFTADRAIVTVPLGVLQAGSITFAPALPAAKVTTIG